MLARTGLFRKILLLGAAFICISTLLLGWFYLQIRDSVFASNKMKTKHVVESAFSAVDAYAKKVKAGEMPEPEARKKALDAVKMLRYDENNYFWVNDMSPRMIMHPFKPDLDGKDMSDYSDPKGKKLFVEFAKVCREKGDGFVDYEWPKPGQEKPSPKLSYVKLVPEWGWIVGSGIYLDDLEVETAQMNKVAAVAFGSIFVIIGGGLLLSWTVARAIANPVIRAARTLDESATQIGAASSQFSSSSQSLAEGSSEQARGISEVTVGISQMDKVTQGNAASAEEIAATSEEMNAQAVAFQAIVRELQVLVNGETARSRDGAPAEPGRKPEVPARVAATAAGGGKGIRALEEAPAALVAAGRGNGKIPLERFLSG